MIAAWFVGSAVIAAWLTCVPSLIGTSPANADTAGFPTIGFRSLESNKALKGDRLVGTHSTIGIRAGEPLKADVSKSRRKIPVGCEAAFSKLTASANYSVRCITSIDSARAA